MFETVTKKIDLACLIVNSTCKFNTVELHLRAGLGSLVGPCSDRRLGVYLRTLHKKKGKCGALALSTYKLNAFRVCSHIDHRMSHGNSESLSTPLTRCLASIRTLPHLLINKLWDIIKEDILAAVNFSRHQHGQHFKAIDTAHLIIIPRK